MDKASIKAIEQLNQCEYLALESLERVPFWGLRVVVEEMLPRRLPENLERDFTPELAGRLAVQFKEEPRPRRFEISWKECICYLVTNECYGKYPEKPETFDGKLFRVFSSSHLLELTGRTTFASADYPGPGPLLHIEIACSDDIVDVIACAEPVVHQF